MLKISRITAGIFRKHLRPSNITGSQVNILFTLVYRGGLTQKQLCDITKLEKSSMNRNLQRLFERNYLRKENFPVIQLTDHGKALANKIIPAWEKAMEEIRQLLGEDGESALDTTLTKLLNEKQSQ
ncbi:MAG: winged helix-turn-helix transcriptional regulator [Flavobacteriales bacterium]|nr:winged helix-turn-helix transcriptional regulator [Flavobacteriales bacterium]